jgi:hypothetical protein
MFDAYCTTCSTRRLIFPSQVLHLDNDAHGIAVTFRCWCGAIDTWTTGRHAATAPLPLAS